MLSTSYTSATFRSVDCTVNSLDMFMIDIFMIDLFMIEMLMIN